LVGDGTNWDLTGINHDVIYNHNTYVSHSRIFANHNTFNRGRREHSIMVADFMVEADFRAAALAEIRGSMEQSRSMDL